MSRQSDRERWVSEDPVHKRADRDDFARDRGRLVHSAALRRLSAKTQVLGPGSDDFVRNRLTHSLEVAQIGREFGGALGCQADVVEVACLAHDLGHPPFGHNGETALDEVAAGIGGFEGNAQTLRILTRLEPKRVHPDGRPAGLNLTRASLDAATKYPWRRGHGPVPTPKFGVYEDDLPVFEWLRAGSPGGVVRCLEADVMDWSDDVAYSVHDVEDAIASGRLDLRRLRDADDSQAVVDVAAEHFARDLGRDTLAEGLERLLATGAVPDGYDGSRAGLAGLKDMTSRLIGRFVHAAEQATRAVHGPGDLGRYEARLVVPEDSRAEVAVLKAVAAHFVMFTGERDDEYAYQRQVVADLAAWFAADPEARLDADLRADFVAAQDDAARLRVVVDQVASLTDVRALALHAQHCP
ncbi:deoxyguanosinetriphosphate triphosphohydrolase [Janibacter anophelis]|uniref:deoxyguanosinetriphosphate triphosphohydrolase n=1 Tax=Janibacter anophelis TaxID=319054 RepID=UPI00082A5E6E|nr:deoxyguanosinetriphosphate triphosphohydrolase [Janibacter anophelis]